jgi:outer membrane protein OmpA-like peptidoglycan-associated protein
MSNLSPKTLCCIGGAALAALACASSPPPRELLDARAVYTRLATTDAPKRAPKAVEDARFALAAAQETYASGAPEYLVRDRAYLSIRASELAQVLATSARKQANREEAWARAQGSAADIRARLSAAEADEKPADERAVPVVEVKDEPRGTVLTVPSQLLFLPGTDDFLPGASERLKPVAEALREEKGKNITVESGETVDRSRSTDVGLSLRRADLVRNFLVAHDVSPERVSVAGLEPKAVTDAPGARDEGRPIVVSLSPAS